MNIQIFGASKSFDTKKAERWFKERRIKFQAIDVRKYGMSRGELASVRQAVGLKAAQRPHRAQWKAGYRRLLSPDLGVLELTCSAAASDLSSPAPSGGLMGCAPL